MYDDLRAPFEALITAILDRGTIAVIDGSYAQEIGPHVEHGTLDAKTSEQILAESFDPDRRELLDFGCGRGVYRRMIESIGYKWTGVDYLAGVAPGAQADVQSKTDVVFYDGRVLPFNDETFGTVYSFLVFEHIQDIGVTFSEIARVLKPGGRLIGQVAYLEQIHDYSTFNFTPLGMKVACAKSGLQLLKVYPATDAFTFLVRRLMVVSTGSDDTPLNPLMGPGGFFHQAVERMGGRIGLSIEHINLLRLMFCTHFVFEVVKPGANGA